MRRLSFVGIVVVVLAIFGCFAYSFYVISQLQSKVTTLQNSLDNLASRGHFVVLSYNWSVRNVGGSMYAVTLNSTILNDSPTNNTYGAVDFVLLFRDKTSVTHFSISGYGPYVTKHVDFPVVYNSSEYYDMTSPDSVWLEFPPSP